jgi:hypothetical protein
MLHLKARIAAALTVAAASLSIFAAAAPANAASLPGLASGDTTTNWAGYFSVSKQPIVEADVSFVVPKVSCAKSNGPGAFGYQGFMWVGIGGVTAFGVNSGVLKQDGVVVFCPSRSKNAAPTYYPFWEVYPGLQKPVRFTKNGKDASVQPGAKITATVDAPSASPVEGDWYFTVTSTYKGVTTTWTDEAYVRPAAAKNNTAEAITEKDAPGLVDLGNVTYTGAVYYTGEESIHPIPSQRVTLVGVIRRSPIITAGNAYQPPGDDFKDAFTTSYAPNWYLYVN